MWELSTQEKIEASGRKKEEGNILFKKQKYERASKRYEKVNECCFVFGFVLIQHEVVIISL